MRLPGRLWFKTTIGGVDWQVRFATTDVVERIGEGRCEAACDPNTHTIYLPWSICDTPSRMRVVAVHELLHATFSGPGECHRLYKLFRCSEDELAETEEDICVHLAPFLVEAYGPYLRFPKPPSRKG